MDWKFFFTTFATIFIAELGDKTQFAAIAAGSRSKSFLEPLLAVVMGLSLAGILGVFAGKWLSTHLDPKMMRYLSGSLFVAIGLWVLFDPKG